MKCNPDVPSFPNSLYTMQLQDLLPMAYYSWAPSINGTEPPHPLSQDMTLDTTHPMFPHAGFAVGNRVSY